MSALGSQLQNLLQMHIIAMSYNLDDYAKGNIDLVLPFVPKETIIAMNERIALMFAQEKTLLRIEAPCIIVGDLHGQILDLYRIFQTFGLPPSRKYLFLGDLVDRGQHSTELILLIYACKLLFPNSIYIIRGNHEFGGTETINSFESELDKLYPSIRIFSYFEKTFGYLPLAAVVNNNYFCVHGGIGPQTETLNDIANIKRPIITYADQKIASLVWSDPEYSDKWKFSSSPRGFGFLFGEKTTKDFLERNGLKMMIRGHSSVNGIEFCHDKKVITVFSASSYSKLENIGAVLMIDDQDTYKEKFFDPMNDPKRRIAKSATSLSMNNAVMKSRPILCVPKPNTTLRRIRTRTIFN